MLPVEQKKQLAAKGYLPLRVAAHRIGVSPPTVHSWISKRRVDGVRVGNYWFVSWLSVLRYYQSRDTRAARLLEL